MKTLFEYISESREYLNPEFGIEEVRVLFTGMADDDEFDEELLAGLCPPGMSTNTLGAILSAYFYSKSGMGGKVTDETCQKFLDMIRKQPVDRIKRILGAGGEGMVYDIGNNRVIKVIFDTNFVGNRDETINQFRRMKGKHFTTLPEVYKVTDNYIIREAIDVYTKKVKDFYTLCCSHVGKGLLSLECMVAQHREAEALQNESISKEQKQTIEWLVTCREELKSIGYKVSGNFGDFRLANIGETKDGKIVYFDW